MSAAPYVNSMTVLKAFAPYFINDDRTGLGDIELAQLDAFVERETAGLVGHWSYRTEDFNDTWFTTDDVTGLKGDCFTLEFVVMRQAA